MDTIALGSTGRTTTPLGFGGSSLMGALNRRQSLALLETAYDAGLRHFDVAPMYGYGEAEGCLGEFMARHPGQVTVTTKYGIPATKSKAVVRLARAVLGPVIQKFPAVKRRLAGAAQTVTATAEKASFSAEEAKSSLEASLAALKTDRIDVWLLHEATASDLADERLLRLLEDKVKAGTIGMFGVGSDGAKIGTLLAERPQFCSVLQFEWSVLDPQVETGSSFRIHHRALTSHFHSLASGLATDAGRCRSWSEQTGADLKDPAILAKLMLKASLVMNPESVILFSSKKKEHIQGNVAVAGDSTLEGPARRLYELVQAERESIPVA